MWSLTQAVPQVTYYPIFFETESRGLGSLSLSKPRWFALFFSLRTGCPSRTFPPWPSCYPSFFSAKQGLLQGPLDGALPQP